IVFSTPTPSALCVSTAPSCRTCASAAQVCYSTPAVPLRWWSHLSWVPMWPRRWPWMVWLKRRPTKSASSASKPASSCPDHSPGDHALKLDLEKYHGGSGTSLNGRRGSFVDPLPSARLLTQEQ